MRRISIRRHDTQELVYELEVPDSTSPVVVPWYEHGPGKPVEPGVVYDYITETTDDEALPTV